MQSVKWSAGADNVILTIVANANGAAHVNWRGLGMLLGVSADAVHQRYLNVLCVLPVAHSPSPTPEPLASTSQSSTVVPETPPTRSRRVCPGAPKRAQGHAVVQSILKRKVVRRALKL